MDLIIWTTDLRNIIGSQQNILPIYNLPNKIKKTPIVGVYGAEGFLSEGHGFESQSCPYGLKMKFCTNYMEIKRNLPKTPSSIFIVASAAMRQ